MTSRSQGIDKEVSLGVPFSTATSVGVLQFYSAIPSLLYVFHAKVFVKLHALLLASDVSRSFHISSALHGSIKRIHTDL